MSNATVITGARNIRCAQLVAVKHALRLEKLGMKHSRGSVAAMWRKHYGMPRRCSIDMVIEAVEQELFDLTPRAWGSVREWETYNHAPPMVGARTVSFVAAPGTGRIVYECTSIQDGMVWVVKVESTARELTPSEVR